VVPKPPVFNLATTPALRATRNLLIASPIGLALAALASRSRNSSGDTPSLVEKKLIARKLSRLNGINARYESETRLAVFRTSTIAKENNACDSDHFAAPFNSPPGLWSIPLALRTHYLHDLPTAYWKLITDLSEIPQENYPFDVFTGNEPGYQKCSGVDEDRGARRTYLGVGPEQNYTYIAALRSKMLLSLIIRRIRCSST